MSIETTMTVKRSNAIKMLRDKNLVVYDNDCEERLEDMLYEHRESIFENYCVVPDDDYVDSQYEKIYW